MQRIDLKWRDRDGVERVESFQGVRIVECNSGPRAGTSIYVDDEKRYIGYDAGSRRLWIFDHVPDDDEIESYSDSDEEFLAAMLKLGRSVRF